MIQPDDPRVALEALVEKWRATAAELYTRAAADRARSSVGLAQPKEWEATRLGRCADDLVEALASSDPPAVQQSIEQKEVMREGVDIMQSTDSPTASSPESQSREICICAAVQTEEGLVIRGHRHHDALRAAGLAFCHPLRTEDGQGFVTSTGRYVTREEGYRLQVAADIGSRDPGGYRGERLFSEDLY